MRYFEIKGGIQVPLSNEEIRLVEEIEKAESINVNEMEQRDAELARILASRGVLQKIESEEHTSYSLNKLEDLWRD